VGGANEDGRRLGQDVGDGGEEGGDSLLGFGSGLFVGFREDEGEIDVGGVEPFEEGKVNALGWNARVYENEDAVEQIAAAICSTASSFS